jgi:hypothetical protein
MAKGYAEAASAVKQMLHWKLKYILLVGWQKSLGGAAYE